MQAKWAIVTVMAVLLAAPCAYADAPAPDAVLVYTPDFFADARPNTAYDMIGRLPGFTFSDVGSARGFAGNAGNVLINGQRPTTKSDSLQSVLSRIPAGNVDHIDLIRGGAPGIDMQGQTVIANVVLKTGDSTQIVATAEDLIFADGHMVPYGALEFTRHADGVTYEGSASLIQNYDDSVGKGYHNIYDGTGALVQHDIAYSHGLGVGVSLKGAVTAPLLDGEFKANITLQDSPFVDRLSYTHPGFTELFGDTSRDNTGELGLHWKGPLGGTELELLALQRFGHNTSNSTSDDLTTTEDFTSLSDTGETIARATVRYLPMPDLTLEAGAEGAYNYLDGRTRFAIDGVDQPLPSAEARVQERRAETFIQGTWKIAPEWLLEAGARFEYSTITETGTNGQSRSFFYPKPRVVLTWSPDKDTQVRLRYEKVVGQLDFNNFIASANLSSTGITVGNENLRPDQHSQFEISYERHFWDKGAVVLTYMHEEITDVVDFVPVTDSLGDVFDAPGNIGSGTNEQIALQVTLPLDKLFIPGGLLKIRDTWDLTSVKDPVTGLPRVISGQRPQTIKINFTQDIDSLKSTWGIFYYNGWDEDYYRLTQFRHRYVAPPYVNIFWDYKPSAEWSFHVEADNITGFVFKDIKYNYTGPRNISPLDNIDTYAAQSRPTIDFQIRRTF